MQPKVSVIITTLNASKFLEQSIESVLNQTYSNLEILIADDCSSDNTRDIIDKYARNDSRIRVYNNDVNLHYLRTRNKLLEKSTGELIGFCDADDYMTSDRIEKQVVAFQEDESLVLCGCQPQYVDENGMKLSASSDKPTSDSQIKASYMNVNPFIGPTLVLKRRVFKELGWYRDFFNGLGNEDYDLTSRIIPHNKCINLSERLYYYRQHDASTSRAGFINNPFKFHSADLVRHFSKQRLESGKDSLEQEDWYAIINWINEKHRPYLEDPSLLYIRQVEGHLYADMPDKAFNSSIQAIKANPWKLYNYRTAFYTLKKTLGS